MAFFAGGALLLIRLRLCVLAWGVFGGLLYFGYLARRTKQLDAL